jgi:hypothetical protein
MNTATPATPAKPAFGERFETFIHAHKVDAKGRSLGFFVVLVDNGVDFHACVQKGIVHKRSKEPVAWGASQPSKKFKSQDEATKYAYATVRERIAKLP